MAPIDQSVVSSTGIDLRRSTGRRADDEQGQQFGDVYSNVSEQADGAAKNSSPSKAADNSSSGGKRTNEPGGDDTAPQPTANPAPTNVIDLTVLAAEVAAVSPNAGTPQTIAPSTATKTNEVVAAPDLKTQDSVTISDVKLQTHLEGPGASATLSASATNMAASGQVSGAKGDDKSTTSKTTPATSTTQPQFAVQKDEKTTDDRDATSSGQDKPTKASAGSKDSVKVGEESKSEPSPKVEATASAVIVSPVGISPTQAVTRVVNTALVQHTSATVSGSEHVATSVLAPPRTLTLQLTPAGMGTVSVTMHAVGQALDLQLAVSNKDTLSAISRDRDVLATSVSDQGYNLRSLVIQSSDGANASSNGSSQGQTQPQAQSGSNRQSAQEGRNDQGQKPQSNQQGARSDETSTASVRPRADALFV